MKRFSKIIGIVLVTVIITSCSILTKQVLGYTEKTLKVSKDIKHISSIKYLGQGIYAVNTSADNKIFKYNLMDSSGNLISDNTFYYVDSYLKFNCKGTIPVMTTDFTKNKKWKYRLIDKQGKFVSKSYDVICPIENGLYEVREDDKYGYIDSTGKEIVEFIKMYLTTLNDPNCRPYKNQKGKYEFLNKEGKNIVPYEFDDFEYTYSSKDLISVYKDHKWGVINKKGTIIKDFQFEDVHGFSEDLISIKQNGKWGCMDCKGNIRIPFKFDGIKDDVHDGLAMVQVENTTAVVDMKGNYIVKPNNTYNFYSWDSQSIIMGNNVGSIDVMDVKSKKVMHLGYKQVCLFNDNIVLVSENIKLGLIDRQGREIIPTNLDYIDKFKNGFCIVSQQGKYGIIDAKGSYKIPFKYSDIKHVCNNYYVVKLNDKWGMIDINDKVIKPIEYDNAEIIELNEKFKFQVFLIKDKRHN